MISLKTRLASVATIAVAATIYAAPASAQATRTWVSGVGNDADPCSRTAPCKTFAGAIIKTANGGEINCLDPGGFGAVTINKSITISCPYTEGGLLAGGNGIVVNATSTDTVYLKGLDIFGVSPPTHGVRILVAAAVHIEDSTIRRFNSASSFGVSFQPSGTTELYLNNVTIAENGSGSTGGGILVQPTGASGVAKVWIANTRINNNANHGLSVNTTGATNANGTTVVVENSSLSGNATGASITHGVGTQTAVVTLLDSTFTGNTTMGIAANGASAFVRASNLTITGNAAGVSAIGGSQIQTYGNNRLVSNPSVGGGADGAFTGAAPAVQ